MVELFNAENLLKQLIPVLSSLVDVKEQRLVVKKQIPVIVQVVVS